MSNTYTEDSIVSLSPLEFTRLRPGVYVGSTEYSTHLLVEIVSNAIDEYKAGHGDTINITISEDNIITVEDNGQGFLVNSKREDGKTILEAAFSVLNTSGKYTDDGVYEGISLGLNGIGSKLSNFLSHHLDVETYRDGAYEKIHFNEGVFENRSIGKCDKTKHGTVVSWQPSEEFFTHPEVDINEIENLLSVLVCLCPGLTINLNNKKYFSKNGLSDLVDNAVKNKEILKKRLNINYNNGKNKLDLVLTYTDSYSSTIIPYVNTGLTDSGPHITQMKTILTRELNKFFRSKGWLKDKDENLSGDDCQEGLYMVFNLTVPGVSYDAQTKSRIVKLDMKPFNDSITEALQNWLNQNEKDIKQLADKAINARKAREAARKAREAARSKNGKKDKALKFDSKLADAYEKKHRELCELFVTEGDSASANLKSARDNRYQAVMPIRGKMLNVQDESLEKILKNAEISTIMDALFGSSGWWNDSKKIEYDISKLRYGKIIIMSDADVDGAHIKNLFYTFIWNICPDLLKQGYIYAGRAPLYKITEKNGKSYTYLRNDEELKKYQSSHPSTQYDIGRMKGLGEMGISETGECLSDPKTRAIDQITVKDVEAANRAFAEMMGTSVVYRKQFLKKYGKEANYNAE